MEKVILITIYVLQRAALSRNSILALLIFTLFPILQYYTFTHGENVMQYNFQYISLFGNFQITINKSKKYKWQFRT
jgi:hypothetical protein